MKKQILEWIKYPEHEPNSSQIFIVVSYKEEEDIYLDQYETRSKRILRKNSEKKIQWAIWKYKEICEDVTETQVIYSKVWNFFDDEENPINGVIAYLELPKFPEELLNG